jgi:hypothetical protein
MLVVGWKLQIITCLVLAHERNIKIIVLSDMMPCSLVDIYQFFHILYFHPNIIKLDLFFIAETVQSATLWDVMTHSLV